MTLFLIFAPFGAFALLMLVASTAVSLFAAAALSLGMIGWDIIRGGSVKMLTAGSVLLFGALGGYITLIDGNWTPVAVRLAVDGGVLAIALLSLAIRLPFTLQYAREAVDAETIKLPGFLRANYIITWAWTAAFVLMLVADMLTIYLPGLPLWSGFALAFAARNSAVYFTKWYPQYRRAKYGAATPLES
ncbi:MAG: hypothetical protein JWR89_889 [Tardiphaga sp.]|jgi:hypothetical protein|uniref:hypothetical protein n=1 Tax=Tardiphaga sp. TaxID=1926292 RepID=UPI00262177BB|nr:hypothetical protein [Tardiphaga sp.]MDB5500987.1 hypothetical protein [Tardiphaga sp.]